jgi:hypothetical protein
VKRLEFALWTVFVGALLSPDVFAQSGYVGLRGLFPPEGGRFSAAPALDALLRLDFGDAQLALQLRDTTILRQVAAAQFTSANGFFEAQLRREPGPVAFTTVLEAGARAEFTFAGPTLGSFGFAYTGSGTGGVNQSLQRAAGGATGEVAPGVGWALQYALTDPLLPGLPGPEHDLEATVRTRIAEPLGVAVGAGWFARDGAAAVSGALEVSFDLSERDLIGLQLNLSTLPSDAQTLFFETGGLFEGLVRVELGRSSQSTVTWGLGLSSRAGLQLALEYHGASVPRAEHSFALALAAPLDIGYVAVRGTARARFNASDGLWYAEIITELSAAVRTAGFSFETRASATLGPRVIIARFEASLSWSLGAFAVLANADLRFVPYLEGQVSVQALYFIVPGIGVNLTGFYRSSVPWLGPAGPGFGVGFILGGS